MPRCAFTSHTGKPKKELHKDMPKEKYLPSRTTVHKQRINRLDMKINENKSRELEDDCIAVAIDSTGVKVTDRGGQWIMDKRHAKKERLFENPHVSKRQDKKIFSNEGNR